jgi:GcrA cell cycle regulator
MTDHAPLTEDELHQDAIGSYYEATAEIGDRVRAGEMELPPMFRPAEPELFWTPERLATLRDLWADHSLSAVKVGAILGCTKNAVIGKAHRLDLPPRIEFEELRERPLHPLFEVGNRDCRFPIGNPGEEGFHFCRVRVETEGRSYCHEHHARSVRKGESEDLVP